MIQSDSRLRPGLHPFLAQVLCILMSARTIPLQFHGDQCISSLPEKQHESQLILVVSGLTCSISLNVARLARGPASSCPDPVQRPCLDKLHQPLETRYHESWRDMRGGISVRNHHETQGRTTRRSTAMVNEHGHGGERMENHHFDSGLNVT